MSPDLLSCSRSFNIGRLRELYIADALQKFAVLRNDEAAPRRLKRPRSPAHEYTTVQQIYATMQFSNFLCRKSVKHPTQQVVIISCTFEETWLNLVFVQRKFRVLLAKIGLLNHNIVCDISNVLIMSISWPRLQRRPKRSSERTTWAEIRKNACITHANECANWIMR